MATVATERLTGHPIHPRHPSFEPKRRGSRVASPADKKGVTQPERLNNELPRAASYTYLPDSEKGHYGQHTVVDIKSFPNAHYVSHPGDVEDLSPPDDSPPASSGWTTPDEHGLAIAPPPAQAIISQLRKSSTAPPSHGIESARSSVNSFVRQSGTSLESERTEASTAASTPVSSHRPSLSSKSFSRRFSRQSWYQSTTSTTSTPSRSPSPQKEEPASRKGSVVKDAGPPTETGDGRRKSLITRTLTGKTMKEGRRKKASKQNGEERQPEKSVTRKGTVLRRKATARASGNLTEPSSNEATSVRSPASLDATPAPAIPAVPSLPKSFSTDRLPTLRTSKSAVSLSDDKCEGAMPRLASRDKVYHPSPLSSVTRKKDELWSVFRTLDADLSKFTSKTTSLKANVVRSSLLPFLRTYAHHPSNKTLRPEDLDRRANILNKWWTGLIEMLHGRNNQSISGTDRPVILDGISGIMERPEWRSSPSPFCPLQDRLKASFAHGNRSNTSLGSSSSDFLADSVHHNVRNIFIQNLSSQMAFVVDKMSLRHASASLVTFCGKACAYAFVFVPGMADVMARLWDLPMDTLRRVLHENGVGKFEQMTDSTRDIAANFPPALHQLAFTSLMKYMRKLMTPPALPVGTQHVQWWGYWVDRWSGRDSDLFYVFAKHFHILATDFLPSNTTKRERMCAPGMLLVHAQILANLDATIHRDANQSFQDATPSATFDEMLGDPDAIASTLPIPPTNAVRLMAENRLIMLIRDFLSDRDADHPIAREIFAQSFSDLLQATARGTSMFDHAACYTLLDFLEEALVILIRYEVSREIGDALMDSDFWLTVCKKMIESENTLTEIRLYAFLYTVWHTIVSRPGRKRELCLGLLLTPDDFESRFNHWCPMVRAYFMRLLCWRVARHDGEAGEDDLRILETLEERLQETWSKHLHLREKAQQEASLLPDTAPCHPAPGRRLLIVRTDHQVNNAGTFINFDGLLNNIPAAMQKPAWKRTSPAASLLDGPDARPESSSTMESDSDSREKGIGGFIRKMMGGSKNRSKSREPAKRPAEAKGTPPLPEGAQSISRAATEDGSHSSAPEAPREALQAPYRSLSFKFSLEYHPSNKQLPPMRLQAPRLPPPAQNLLRAKTRNSASSATSSVQPVEPRGESIARARYSGRALAEWTVVVGECHSFFERRKHEGAPSNRHVETPTLGVEVFKRPS
ncbi:Hypothetical predicted protein [Lecanosticta acicola]|uniref:DUF1765-domain-containing protein n=1 Tax=Lecanosticta acicola TaxID=111012 RepID=A0AAI8YVJ9_9PEZI|nr:Hypothetical predicted protein [Lecanosticta acicola]